jgi:multiple sugar transport system ATP-binding protein
MSRVNIKGITKVFPNGVRALDNLDLEIKDGEFFALLGPSGCGKTTLLRTLGGLESATDGHILIDDNDVTRTSAGDRNVAMVFQDYALYPHMNVQENIEYPLKIRKYPKEDREERVRKAATALSIENLLDRRPGQISGGQQQRVAVARAMATTPNLYLFDEPLSNLDARLRLEARSFLKQLQRELGVTTILVTHDQSEALALADRMAVMELGKIRQVGSPVEFFHRPANIFVASFIGSTPMNLLEGKILGKTISIGSFSFDLAQQSAAALAQGEQVTLGVRPEYVQVTNSAGPGVFSGVVRITENLGTHYLVLIDAEGLIVRGTVPDGSEPKIGEMIHFRPDPDRILIYNTTSGDLI